MAADHPADPTSARRERGGDRVEACVRHCLARPWEPHKYESREAQDRNLDLLVAWVRAYADRDDACSLSAHQRLFAAFPGSKREVVALP